MSMRMGIGSRAWWRLQRLLRAWSIHTPTVLVVRGTPDACLVALANAAKPRAARLDLRNLYMSGRRYEVVRRGEGFRLRTTHRVAWHPRRRSTSAAVMNGTLTPLTDDLTRIALTARISLDCLFNTLVFPTVLAMIIAYVPWPPLVISTLLGVLYGLSWTGNRANAVLEVNEMVFFVQQSLEEFGTAEMPTLSSAAVNGGKPDTIFTQRDFRLEWEKFYREHAEE